MSQNSQTFSTQKNNLGIIAQKNKYSYNKNESATVTKFNSESKNNTASQGTIRQKQLSASMLKTANISPFKNAFLLVQKEANAVIDRRVLRDSGLDNIRILTSGIASAKLLIKLLTEDDEAKPDIIICHNDLADMSAANFIALIRMHPLSFSIPILCVASFNSEADKLQVLCAGFSGVIVRPYSPTDLKTVLADIALPENKAKIFEEAKQNINTQKFDQALNKFESVTTNVKPEELFKLAMQCLKDRKWDDAIKSFHKTMKLSALKGESELGIATAYKGKGNIDLYKAYLEKAGITFAKAAKWHKARIVYCKLLKEDPTAQSPFLAAAERLIRAEKYEEAAEAFACGYDLSPEDESEKRLIKACCYADNHENAASCMAISLSKNSMAHIADNIKASISTYVEEHDRKVKQQKTIIAQKAPIGIATRSNDALLDEIYTEEELEFLENEKTTKNPIFTADEHIKPGMFANVPILGDALMVMKMTWKLYNSGKK